MTISRRSFLAAIPFIGAFFGARALAKKQVNGPTVKIGFDTSAFESSLESAIAKIKKMQCQIQTCDDFGNLKTIQCIDVDVAIDVVREFDEAKAFSWNAPKILSATVTK